MKTDTSEWGLETLIVEHMTGRRSTAPPVGGMAEESVKQMLPKSMQQKRAV